MTASRLDAFLRFSSEVTGFKVVELRGTGQSEAYMATVDKVVGSDLTDALLATYHDIGEPSGPTRERDLRRAIFGDERLGPIARNVVKLWYVGIWYQLPTHWRETNGVRADDVTFTVSPSAYTEGLLWPAIGANPAGAKAPGYGSWALPPRIPEV